MSAQRLGLLILDRYLQRIGVNLRTLSLLDRLAIVGPTGRGALEFRPDRSAVPKQEYADFEKLALEAGRILESEDYTGGAIEEFQYRGGSPGGARPKICTRHAGKEWLVKFCAKGDPQSIGINEYRCSLLAKQCGIEMPATQLFEDRYFGAERFDRTPNGKLHVVSIAGLVGADYRLPCIDYTHIFQVCAVLAHSVVECRELKILLYICTSILRPRKETINMKICELQYDTMKFFLQKKIFLQHSFFNQYIYE